MKYKNKIKILKQDMRSHKAGGYMWLHWQCGASPWDVQGLSLTTKRFMGSYYSCRSKQHKLCDPDCPAKAQLSQF